MDYKQLVDEILIRVAAKMADLEGDSSAANKRRILILTEHHGIICHELLENTKLQTCCQMDCALQKEYNCDLEDYDAIVIYNLTNHALSKLAGGIIDTPFTSLASKAILMGKRVLVPTEEIELYLYEKTAPDAYYAMMCDKLKLLQDSGVTICRNCELENILAGSCQSSECLKKEKSKTSERKYTKIEKKVITERDLKILTANGATCISINSNAILTDLAKEYLNTRKIAIEREISSGRRQGYNI